MRDMTEFSFNAECVFISKEQMEENLTRSMVV